MSTNVPCTKMLIFIISISQHCKTQRNSSSTLVHSGMTHESRYQERGELSLCSAMCIQESLQNFVGE